MKDDHDEPVSGLPCVSDTDPNTETTLEKLSKACSVFEKEKARKLTFSSPEYLDPLHQVFHIFTDGDYTDSTYGVAAYVDPLARHMIRLVMNLELEEADEYERNPLLDALCVGNAVLAALVLVKSRGADVIVVESGVVPVIVDMLLHTDMVVRASAAEFVRCLLLRDQKYIKEFAPPLPTRENL